MPVFSSWGSDYVLQNLAMFSPVSEGSKRKMRELGISVTFSASAGGRFVYDRKFQGSAMCDKKKRGIFINSWFGSHSWGK